MLGSVSDHQVVEKISEWYEELWDSASSLCLKIVQEIRLAEQSEFLYPNVVATLLKHNSIGPLLHSSTSAIACLDDRSDFDRWLHELWNRRWAYFLSQLGRGLNTAAEKRSPEGNLPGAIGILNEFAAKLEESTPRATLEEDSINHPDDVAMYVRTYLDPILFTALFEFSHNSDDHVRKEALLTAIDHWFNYYTEQGDYRAPWIADESTIWWALLVLATEKGDKFGRTNDLKLGDVANRKQAVRVFGNLLGNPTKKIRYPQPQLARFEATSEIHGLARTVLLSSKNIYNLLSYFNNDENVREMATNYIARCLQHALNEKPQIDKHCYLLGLALEVFATILPGPR